MPYSTNQHLLSRVWYLLIAWVGPAPYHGMVVAYHNRSHRTLDNRQIHLRIKFIHDNKQSLHYNHSTYQPN